MLERSILYVWSLYVEVSEGPEQVQQIETTAPAMSVHVLLGAGQGLGAYSEMKSATRRGESSRRLNCRHYGSGQPSSRVRLLA